MPEKKKKGRIIKRGYFVAYLMIVCIKVRHDLHRKESHHNSALQKMFFHMEDVTDIPSMILLCNRGRMGNFHLFYLIAFLQSLDDVDFCMSWSWQQREVEIKES